MTDEALLTILYLISALTILASVGLLETAKRRDRKWWNDAATADPNNPNTANLATTLLRTIDLAHYAWCPAALGAVAGLAAIATASYTYAARERITDRTRSDGN